MSEARAAIFAAIAAARGGRSSTPEEIEREARALAARSSATRLQIDGDPVERFVSRVTEPGVGATLARVPSLAGVPRAAAAYLAEQGLPLRLALAPAPALRALDWSGLECRHEIDRNENASVTLAAAAIAETGSLVFGSGPGSPELMNFLPLHHVAVLEARSIAPYLEDAWSALRRSGIERCRALTLVTGCSATADIEATQVRGAHGPAFLHVVLVG